ncbi:MAG: 5-(carboxyamino)imidazole ribonucleotide synthase [Acidobacteria bacterium]|nr:5-(carboxyamino)imidazole ribonucleotide synthase [Acidobacteriota bacterium]
MILINPGSIIGIFGSGQLGRMFALEARKMGFRVATFSPGADTPTGRVSDFEITSAYEDLGAVEEFAKSVNVVTFEFENIPSATIETASRFVKVHPGGEVLHITQNRLREKTFLSENGFPVAPYKHISTVEDLFRAVDEIGMPCVLKTAGFGYDGKGQSKIESTSDIESSFDKLSADECVLEGFIDFEKEVSVVCARDEKGNFAHYGVIENDHVNHILDVSFLPGDVSGTTKNDAIEIARGIAEKFDYVGTLCVEFFVMNDGSLIVNEIAPRPHNSGHLTFDASCVTSQFEQQLRAVCGIPLGSTEFFRPVAMANLLGDLWANGEPNWERVLEDRNLKLHLYGKDEARPGRKMGHLTAAGETIQEAVKTVKTARDHLTECP